MTIVWYEDITIPEMDGGVQKCRITKWHAQGGQTIIRGDSLVDLEANGRKMTLLSPLTGPIVSMDVEEGEVAHVGQQVAKIKTPTQGGWDRGQTPEGFRATNLLSFDHTRATLQLQDYELRKLVEDGLLKSYTYGEDELFMKEDVRTAPRKIRRLQNRAIFTVRDTLKRVSSLTDVGASPFRPQQDNAFDPQRAREHLAYHETVEAAWSSQTINQNGLDNLASLQQQLGIDKDAAEAIERAIIGKTIKQAATHNHPPTEHPTSRGATLSGMVTQNDSNRLVDDGRVGDELPTLTGEETQLGNASPQTDHTLVIGSLICERYQIMGFAGRGGMGEVYRAFDTRIGEVRALKILAAEHIERDDLEDRMRRELRLCQRLRHPSIVQAFDFDIDNTTKRPFIVMEFVEGRTLRDWLNKFGDTRPTMAKVTEIASNIVAAIQHAHDRGVIHLDLKPANILIEDRSQDLRILDFGISRMLDTDGLQTMLTGAGTPYYMAPEHERKDATIGAAADIYSLAIIFYELLVGRIPRGVFKAPHKVRDGTPEEWSMAIMQAMEDDPDQRPAIGSLNPPVMETLLDPSATRTLWIEFEDSWRVSQSGRDGRAPIEARKRNDEVAGKFKEIDIALLRESAESGDAYAQLILARRLQYGWGITNDSTLSTKYYFMAAEQGIPFAELEAAECHAYGMACMIDEAKGFDLCQRAASKDYVEAMNKLSYWYSEGIGVESDERKAAEWTRKAAELGDPDAQCYLADRYESGRGVIQDRAEALKWYRRSAEQGHVRASSERDRRAR
jgi:serine/threonine protein kinase